VVVAVTVLVAVTVEVVLFVTVSVFVMVLVEVSVLVTVLVFGFMQAVLTLRAKQRAPRAASFIFNDIISP
jgi:hypothetical protein